MNTDNNNTLRAAGQTACINCNASFIPANTPECPSCGLHYQEMICMNCGENFPIPSSQSNRRDIDCPYCHQSSFRPFYPGVTDYKMITAYPQDVQYPISEQTEYAVYTDMPAYPFNADNLQKHPRLIQYNPVLPLSADRVIPFPSREYSFGFDKYPVADAMGYNKKIHIVGMSLLCNTMNTPSGAKLCARVRDRQQNLFLEAKCVPAKGAKEFCLFNLDSCNLDFSWDICLSLWWEMDGAALDKDIILPSTTDSEGHILRDRQGVSFNSALVLYGHVFDIVTGEVISILTDYPTTAYPTTDYPTTDYPTTDYPTTDYPTTDYPTTDYPTTDYPIPDIAIPDSITFTLMAEDERNLTYQQGLQGKMNVYHEDKADFTFYQDKYPAGTTLRLDFIDLAVPSEQFGNPSSIDVTVWPHWNASPISLNASWYNKNMLRINLQPLGLQSVPVQSIMVKVSSRNKFSFFTSSPSCGPVGGVFGYADLPTTAPTDSDSTLFSMESQEVGEASTLQTIPDGTGLASPVMRAAIPTDIPTDIPITGYPTEYPTDYPTSYITGYPTNRNRSDFPADNDEPLSATANLLTCYCFKEDGTCDDDDLKNGNKNSDTDDTGAGGFGDGNGGNGGGGSGSGGVNKGGTGSGSVINPGFSKEFGKQPNNSQVIRQGNIEIIDYKTVNCLMSSPNSIIYTGINQRRVAGINSPTGKVNDAKNVCIVNEKGYPRFSSFDKDGVNAYPSDRTRNKPERVEKFIAEQPDGSKITWLLETLQDGTIIRYNAATGEPDIIKPPAGQ